MTLVMLVTLDQKVTLVMLVLKVTLVTLVLMVTLVLFVTIIGDCLEPLNTMHNSLQFIGNLGPNMLHHCIFTFIKKMMYKK